MAVHVGRERVPRAFAPGAGAPASRVQDRHLAALYGSAAPPSLAVSVAIKWPGLSASPAHPRVPQKVNSRVLASQTHAAVGRTAQSYFCDQGRVSQPSRVGPQGQPRGLVPPPCGLGLDPVPPSPAPCCPCSHG